MRWGSLKGAREAFKVNEETLNDDGKTLKSDEGAVKGNGEALDIDGKALKSGGLMLNGDERHIRATRKR